MAKETAARKKVMETDVGSHFVRHYGADPGNMAVIKVIFKIFCNY